MSNFKLVAKNPTAEMLALGMAGVAGGNYFNPKDIALTGTAIELITQSIDQPLDTNQIAQMSAAMPMVICMYRALVDLAPKVEQQPIAWASMKDGRPADFYASKKQAEFLAGFAADKLEPLYLMPQPAPDIDVLVAAMEKLLDAAITTGKMTDINYWPMRSAIQDADTALCNYEKKGGPA